MSSNWDFILPFLRPIEHLILDDSISDLCVNGSTGVFIERHGRMSRVDGLVLSSEDLLPAVQNIARLLGKDFSEDRPMLDARLPNGARVSAIGFHCAPIGTSFVVRKFNHWFSLDELVAAGSVPGLVATELIAAVASGANILVSGGTGSGKTTLVKALADHIHHSERLITIENPIEIRLDHENVVRLEAQDQPGQCIGVAELLIASLRQRPDRILIGEVRDATAAYQLLQAINTGHGGTLSTVHAEGAVEALRRIANLALSAYPNLDHAFIRSETAQSIDIVVHVKRFPDGKRRVTELARSSDYNSLTNEFNAPKLYQLGQLAMAGSEIYV